MSGRPAVTGDPFRMHRPQWIDRARDLRRALHVAGQRRLGVIVHRQVAGHLVEMRAVVEQPPIAHDAQVVEPRRLVGNADDQFVADRLAQRDRRRRRRPGLLETADVRDRREPLRQMLAIG